MVSTAAMETHILLQGQVRVSPQQGTVVGKAGLREGTEDVPQGEWCASWLLTARLDALLASWVEPGP